MKIVKKEVLKKRLLLVQLIKLRMQQQGVVLLKMWPKILPIVPYMVQVKAIKEVMSTIVVVKNARELLMDLNLNSVTKVFKLEITKS